MSVYAYTKSQVVYWFVVEFLVELCFDAVKITHKKIQNKTLQKKKNLIKKNRFTTDSVHFFS